MFYNTDQFADFIKKEIKAAMKEFLSEKESCLLTTNSRPEKSRYLRREQVSDYLGIGLSTVDLWARIGKLNKIDYKGSPRYDILEIDAQINNLRKYNNGKNHSFHSKNDLQ